MSPQEILRRTVVAAVIVAASPLLVAIAILVAVTSGYPILFRQVRIGKHGKPFVMYKFRTMFFGAEHVRKRTLGRNEAKGPVFKMKDDPRFTRLGKVLSHTGLDELPQLFNIFSGDMRFIGPRPLPVDEAARLKPWMRKREAIEPGIISPWVFIGYHNTSFTAWMKSDVHYATTKNFWDDAMLLGRGALLLVYLLTREGRRISRSLCR